MTKPISNIQLNGMLPPPIPTTNRISLPVVQPEIQAPVQDPNELEKEIGWLTMNNEYKKAIPKALEWLLSKDIVTQSECIHAAGICLLGERHDIYSTILSMVPSSRQRNKAFSSTEKDKLNQLASHL